MLATKLHALPWMPGSKSWSHGHLAFPDDFPIRLDNLDALPKHLMRSHMAFALGYSIWRMKLAAVISA
jgi:hypothetical protein